MIDTFLKSIFFLLAGIGVLVGAGVGIIKAIDYIEDKAYAAKKRITTIVQISMALHLILLFRGVSIFQVLFSLSIQYSFYCMLDGYPMIKLDSPFFIYGTAASLVNHFLVIRLLFNKSVYGAEMVCYFILIWTTPFCFFISLSANDEVLFSKGKTTTNTIIGTFLKNILNKEKR